MMRTSEDIDANRKHKNYSRQEYIGRVLWDLVSVLFRMTPRQLHFVRIGLLRSFGAKIGARCRIHPRAHVFLPWMLTVGDDVTIGDRAELYCLGPMTIGDRVTISQRAYLCGGTHKFESPEFDLVRSPIVIESDAWICADAFIGPGVTVGASCVVGARAAVFKDCARDTIYGGNPAQIIRVRENIMH